MICQFEDLLAAELPPLRHHGENTATAVLTCRSVLNPTSRLVLSALLFSGWLALLLFGYTFGGAAYLLLPASVVLFPWKSLRA